MAAMNDSQLTAALSDLSPAYDAGAQEAALDTRLRSELLAASGGDSVEEYEAARDRYARFRDWQRERSRRAAARQAVLAPAWDAAMRARRRGE